MTSDQIRALRAGDRAFASTTSSPGQTIIVQNPANVADNCASCDEASCEVVPTTATALDFNSFKYNKAATVRFTISNSGTSDVQFPLAGGWDLTDAETIDPERFGTPEVSATSFVTIAGLTVNGEANATRPFRYLVQMLEGGAVLASVTLRAGTADNASNEAFVNQDVEIVHYRTDPSEGGCAQRVFSPFCDECVSSNNSSTQTHSYRTAAPITYGDIVNLEIPAGASNVIVEYCFAIIGIRNHDGDSATKQMS